ncbi:MAG TPA: tRNA pseudouridine(55) synthase TruB [Candidatus Limiplasma sp.]|nr:tRNA pseudouridine(55) synthase TruB [Candidatus Limiplasma sp.]HPS81401.1 tRNA pseudouridine(55) synthase TruB [Candidatus Limiplasma sp.]
MTEPLKPQKQAFCGFLNVLKPPGMTSAQVVGRVRRLLRGEKVGHAGTLDPEAAGVLPLMLGKAARLFDYMQDKQKAYITEVAFGCATDTQDAQGMAVSTGSAVPDEPAVRAALPAFMGEQLQTPPMYSALKRDGHKLYELARKGETVELEGRPVTVYALEWMGATGRNGALLSVNCSKGFYVRTLCHDLGLALGCPAHMRFLLRTQSGPFTLDTAVTLETLQEAAERESIGDWVLPMETALSHLPVLTVPMRLEKPFRNGILLPLKALPDAPPLAEGQAVRMSLNGRLTAIGVREGDEIRQRTWLEE